MPKPETVRFGMPQTEPTPRENLDYAAKIAAALREFYRARILAVTETMVTAEFDDADDALDAAIDLDANDRLEPDPEHPGQVRLSSASLWGDDDDAEAAAELEQELNEALFGKSKAG